MTFTLLWEPQPGLAWAACHAVEDGKFCTMPAAGFRTCSTTGSSMAGLSMCEKHGNPEGHRV